MFAHSVLRITESGGVFGAFMRGIGFEFSAIGGAVRFDFRSFFLGKLGLRGGLLFRSVQPFVLLTFFLFGFFFREFGSRVGVNFLYFVLFEFGATGEGVGVSVVGSFLMFCFDKLRREGRGLIFTEIVVALRILGLCAARHGQLEWRSFVPRRIRAVRRKGSIFRCADVFVGRHRSGFGLGSGVGENPAGKSTGEAAGNVSARRSSRGNGGDRATRRAGSRFFYF